MMKTDQHVTLVAALQIGFGVLGILIGLVIFVAVTGGGILSQDAEAIAITSIVGSVVGGIFVLTSIPEVIGGIGLLKRKNWARILIIIISCLDLLAIPFGTAIGIYSLWVLLREDTVKYFQEQNESLPEAK
ncbi:MAG: hypothetical protein GXO74_11915 [Calditrichaeota bacterium]|nr:hypothetical protein [Calditrichota bacterium]